MTPSPDRSEIRAAAYLAAQSRQDLGPGRRSRTGKTRRPSRCTPGNKLCGSRCIPIEWDCRLKGQGADNHTNANKTDPLAGIASLQRGAKDLARGIVTVDPSRVQRGRSSVIRGVIKLTPGDDLEKKKQLKRRLTDATTPIAAVIGVALVGVGAHAGMKRGFISYRRGLGADIDQAAARAVDSVLDRMPGVASGRAATRSAASAAATDITTSALRGARMRAVRQATSGNTNRIGPLSFRPTAADYESSNLVNRLNELQRSARDGGMSYEQWQRSGVETLYGARSPGTRTQGQRGSVFSEHAANEFLVSKFGLSSQGAIGSNGSFSMPARNALVEQQLGERLSSWGRLMREDMQLRRYTSANGEIRFGDVNRYLREVGNAGLEARLTHLTAPQRHQITNETTRLMRTAITGGTRDMTAEARSMRRALVAQYDTYFNDIAQGMQRNAAASDSPFGDGLAGLARYVTRTTGQTTPILSRDHADLILRHHYHTRVMQLKSDFMIGDSTAQRVAQRINRSPDLPDVDTAYRILNENGFPRLSRGAPATGRAPGSRRRSNVKSSAQPEEGRGDSLTPRVRSYLEARQRLDFQTRDQRLGKPCGRSFIPKGHKCGREKQATLQLSNNPEAETITKTPTAGTKQVANGAKVVGIALGAAAAVTAITVATDATRYFSDKFIPTTGSYKTILRQELKATGSTLTDASQAMANYYDKAAKNWRKGEIVYYKHPKDPQAHFGIYLGKVEGRHQFAGVGVVAEGAHKSGSVGLTEYGPNSRYDSKPVIWAKAPDKVQPIRAYSDTEIIRRAKLMLGKPYSFDLLENNCEGWASMIVSGVPHSTQIKRFSIISKALLKLTGQNKPTDGFTSYQMQAWLQANHKRLVQDTNQDSESHYPTEIESMSAVKQALLIIFSVPPH